VTLGAAWVFAAALVSRAVAAEPVSSTGAEAGAVPAYAVPAVAGTVGELLVDAGAAGEPLAGTELAAAAASVPLELAGAPHATTRAASVAMATATGTSRSTVNFVENIGISGPSCTICNVTIDGSKP
jgi:hypothetical protein